MSMRNLQTHLGTFGFKELTEINFAKQITGFKVLIKKATEKSKKLKEKIRKLKKWKLRAERKIKKGNMRETKTSS